MVKGRSLLFAQCERGELQNRVVSPLLRCVRRTGIYLAF
jgi:hypothetical protein